jgi:tRNA pseudouridine38/39 synthase
MVAVLFLVGQGLERPSIVSELLNTKKNPRRPVYEMATDTPLVLWDCIFPHTDDADRKDAVQWLYVGDGQGNGEAKYGTPGLMDNLWETWRERKIDEILAGSLINLVSKQGAKVAELEKGDAKVNRSQKVFDGNDTPRFQGKYIPVMKKQLMDSAEVVNEKYALRKGFQSSEDMKSKGFRAMKKSGKPANIDV